MFARRSWMNENRAALKKPGMSVTDVARAGGEEWKKVSDKSKWEKKAAAEKAKYEKAMAAYHAGGSDKSDASPVKEVPY